MEDFQFLTPHIDKDNKSTPVRNAKKPCRNLTPILKTPNGTKVSHSFISNLITNRYNSQINDELFKEKDRTPSNVDCLSPDFVGTLFPKEIETNRVQLQCFENLYKKYRDYFNVKSSHILIDESIAPSPDSAIGSSLETTKSNVSELSEYPNCLFTQNTPPSRFKWNRKEYRSNSDGASSLDLWNKSDEIDDEYIPNWNFESTQIFDNDTRLVDNVSMRRHSAIGAAIATNRNSEEHGQVSLAAGNPRKRRQMESIDPNSSISSILRNSRLCDSEIDGQPPMKSPFFHGNGDLNMENRDFDFPFYKSSSNWQSDFDSESDLLLSPILVDIGMNFETHLPDFNISPIKADLQERSI